jgi:hypothetical protein
MPVQAPERPPVVPLELAGEATPEPQPEADEGLRVIAIQHLERVRRFKLDLGAYVVGMIALTIVWAVTEYENSGGWPSRLSDGSDTGSWNPWILWVALGWGFFVALDALKTYFRRPTTEAEIAREIERLTAHR